MMEVRHFVGLQQFAEKSMPRQLHMTYVPAQKRWTKKYRGSTYSVSCKQLGCEPSREASWLAANQWWEKKQGEIDARLLAAEQTPERRAEARIRSALDGLNVEQL